MARFDKADAGLINEFNKFETDELQSIWVCAFVVFTHDEGMDSSTEALSRTEENNPKKSHPDWPPLLKESSLIWYKTDAW